GGGVQQRLPDVGRRGKVGRAHAQVVDRAALSFQSHLLVVQGRENLVPEQLHPLGKFHPYIPTPLCLCSAHFSTFRRGLQLVDGGCRPAHTQHGGGDLGPAVAAADAVGGQPVAPLVALEGVLGQDAEHPVD